jgi:alpha-tubulin suppressor-like RCC1 family protein
LALEGFLLSLTVRRLVSTAAALGLVVSSVVVGLSPAVATAANNSEVIGAVTGTAGPTATALTGGFGHTCAVLDPGAVTCWGYNQYGQLGNITSSATANANPDPLPVVLPAGTTATALTAGYLHTCAVLNTGEVSCWGYNNRGQLGNRTRSGTDGPNSTPLLVVLPAGTTATALTSGYLHTCAVLNTGEVYCWGWNRYGQLGNSTNSGSLSAANSTPLPVVLPAGTTATALTAGYAHTCALLNTGEVYCWGFNPRGQLGNSTNSGSLSAANSTPLLVGLPAGATATALTAGYAHTCAVLTTDAVTCWGHNNRGQLGNSTNSGSNSAANSTPLLVGLPAGATATALTAGDTHTCAVLTTGAVTCWGRNNFGQLGNSTNSGMNIPNPTPLLVGLPAGATATAATAGDSHTCAVLNTGEVSCWGWNIYGQLGNSTTSGSSTANPDPALVVLPVPVTVPGAPTSVTGVAGDGQVVVSWDAPVDDGGSVVTGYMVTSSPGAKTCTTAGALSCTVGGLANGTGYTFTVTATNTVGLSVPSESSALVVPVTVPGAPLLVTGVAGDGQVVVSWLAPATNGGSTITGYKVN